MGRKSVYARFNVNKNRNRVALNPTTRIFFAHKCIHRSKLITLLAYNNRIQINFVLFAWFFVSSVFFFSLSTQLILVKNEMVSMEIRMVQGIWRRTNIIIIIWWKATKRQAIRLQLIRTKHNKKNNKRKASRFWATRGYTDRYYVLSLNKDTCFISRIGLYIIKYTYIQTQLKEQTYPWRFFAWSLDMWNDQRFPLIMLDCDGIPLFTFNTILF